jgi:hypothetical protein
MSMMPLFPPIPLKRKQGLHPPTSTHTPNKHTHTHQGVEACHHLWEIGDGHALGQDGTHGTPNT